MESKTRLRSRYHPVLKFLKYASVFVFLNLSLAWLCYNTYGVRANIDWVLTVLYSTLAMFSFYVFVVNDIHAVRLQGRGMALGFLSGHMALVVLCMSFVFEAPIDVAWYVAGFLMCVSYILGTYGINKWSKYYKESKSMMRHELRTDELTQLYNRRAFATHAMTEREFCIASNSDLSVLILDIDDFKLINDQYGHAVGDEVLIQVSHIIKSYVRKSDCVYRWGGEEFVCLLPVTGLFEANQVANKLVAKISDTDFNISNVVTINLTVSIGVAQWVEGESISRDTLVRADKALYNAKQNGKNAAVVADYKEAQTAQ